MVVVLVVFVHLCKLFCTDFFLFLLHLAFSPDKYLFSYQSAVGVINLWLSFLYTSHVLF